MTEQDETTETTTGQDEDALEVPTFEMPGVEEYAVDLRFDDNTPIFNETVDDLGDQLAVLDGKRAEQDPAEDGEQDENPDGDDSGEVEQD
ncbi:hypothetical protein [Amycolatopsis taiwanensis]|uniref:hypothetical protein n=1 Tax=Amycolatopsis taiwanensis TaxID=342230 RepID=UPI0004AD4465|nr:hypothetical protein [Amycolatopsis taiwanensis]